MTVTIETQSSKLKNTLIGLVALSLIIGMLIISYQNYQLVQLLKVDIQGAEWVEVTGDINE